MSRRKSVIMIFGSIWLIVSIFMMDIILAINGLSIFWRILVPAFIASGVILSILLFRHMKQNLIVSIKKAADNTNKKQTKTIISHCNQLELRSAQMLAQSLMPLMAAVTCLRPELVKGPDGCATESDRATSLADNTEMLTRSGADGDNCSKPDETVLSYLTEIVRTNKDPVYYEIGIGTGATAVAVADLLENRGKIIFVGEEPYAALLSENISRNGFDNIDISWCVPRNTSFSYHFEFATGAVGGLLPKFDLAYLDPGHLFYLDASAIAVLKELCKPGGYILIDDYSWSLKKSPSMSPTLRSETVRLDDHKQIGACHVELVCRLLMDTDKRFEFLGLQAGDTAVYRMIVD